MNRQNFLSENEKQICDNALAKMKDQFSSREFNKALNFFGIIDISDFVKQDKSIYYLKMHCRILKGRRTWIKKNAKNFWDELREETKQEPTVVDAINEAIKLLINTGQYKIFIKTEEFKEII
jgi:hypothetical protein